MGEKATRAPSKRSYQRADVAHPLARQITERARALVAEKIDVARKGRHVEEQLELRADDRDRCVEVLLLLEADGRVAGVEDLDGLVDRSRSRFDLRGGGLCRALEAPHIDRKSTRLNSNH